MKLETDEAPTRAASCPAYADLIVHAGDRTFDVLSPYDGKLVGVAPDMRAEHAKLLIDRADRAAGQWRAVSPRARADVLHEWSRRILSRADDLAQLICDEQGKTLEQAKGEVAYGATFVDWYAEEGRRVYGEVIWSNQPEQNLIVTREPVGVCVAITPWNYPLAMVTRKIAPALAAGCPVVLKPAEATPLTALALAHLAEEAGLPNGVLGIVTTSDPAPVGEVFAQSRVARHLSFTGSVPVGQRLLAMAASTVKRCTMELGGNAPFLVLDDADLDLAVEGLIAAKFRNSGQTCICPNRVLVHESVYREFAQKLGARVAGLTLANSGDRHGDLGPLISKKATQKICRLVDDAVASGAQVYYRRLDAVENDTFMRPVVLGSVSPAMGVFQQEVFGPVISLTAFAKPDEAIELANATPYGLAAYIFTGDIGRALKLSDQLEFGMIGMNEVALSQDIVPFGGIKQSGLGRESSRHGIEEYLELKTKCLTL